MTAHANDKARIRERMTQTGEMYVVARRAVLAQDRDTTSVVSPSPGAARPRFPANVTPEPFARDRAAWALFKAAADLFGYPPGATRAATEWVHVSAWVGVAPVVVTVAYPAGWPAADPAARARVEQALRSLSPGDAWRFDWQTEWDRVVCEAVDTRAAGTDPDPLNPGRVPRPATQTRYGQLHRERADAYVTLYCAIAKAAALPYTGSSQDEKRVTVDEWDDNRVVRATILLPAGHDQELTENNLRTVLDRTAAVPGWDASWVLDWTVPGQVTITASHELPDTSPLASACDRPWNEFGIGVRQGGAEVIWDIQHDPHLALDGRPGSGKSTVLRAVVDQALRSPDWRVVAVDLQAQGSVSLFGSQVRRLATTLQDADDAISDLSGEVALRHDLMAEQSVTNFRNLTPRPPAILLVVDGSPQAAVLVERLIRTGRSAGVHVVFANQHCPSGMSWARIHMGWGIEMESSQIRGRGYAELGNFKGPFQAYLVADVCDKRS